MQYSIGQEIFHAKTNAKKVRLLQFFLSKKFQVEK